MSNVNSPSPEDRERLSIWVSAYFDDELSEPEVNELFAAMAEDPDLQEEFASMSALFGGTLGPTDAEALSASVMAHTISPDALAQMAFADLEGEAPATMPLAPQFFHTMEASSAFLHALTEAPEAAKAGQAALQAIQAAQENEKKADADISPTLEVPSLWQRVRDRMPSPAFGLMVSASAVALLMVFISPNPIHKPEVESPTFSMEDWLDKTARNSVRLPGEEFEGLELLADNSDTEVEELETDGQVAAVFATEESQITVIWISEEESGT